MDTTTADAPTEDGPPPSDPPPGRARPARILRSSDDRVLGGVAGGIAEYFAIDPLLVRLGFVVASFLGGVGLVAYIVAWIVLPSAEATIPVAPRRKVDTRQLLGFGLVALGLAVIPGTFGFGFGGRAFWPVALIAIGVAVLWLRSRDAQDPPPADDDPHAEPPSPSTASLALPAPEVEPLALPPPSETSAAPEAATAAGGDGATGKARRYQRSRPWRAPRAPRPQSHLTAITLSALLVLAGGAWLLDLAGWVSVDLGTVFALGLAVVGVALVVSAWRGRARGLIALGILLALIVGAFGVIDVPLRGGIGDATYRPRTIGAVDSTYEMAIGRMTVDLRNVAFTGHQRTVHATLGLGKLQVLVPDGVRVVVKGHAGAGSVHAFGTRTKDCCPTDVRRVRPGDAGGGRLVLDAEVGAGDIEIQG